MGFNSALMAYLHDNDIPDTYICPGCGAELAVGTRGCKHCSDVQSGSSKHSTIPDEEMAGYMPDTPGYDKDAEDFDYDAYLEREFGDHPDGKKTFRISKGNWVKFVAASLIIILLYQLYQGLI